MVTTYSRPDIVFERGQGVELFDIQNRRYLDMTAGIAVTSLGHSDKGVAKVLAEESAKLMHASNLYHNLWTGALCQSLVEETSRSGAMQYPGYNGHGAVESVFVCNSGSEANEAAIKFARKVGKVRDPSGGRTEIVSFTGAFHGRTMGSLSATHTEKYQKPFGPMVPGFRCGTFNDIAAIDGLVTEKTCGVIVEPIQGEGGVHPATDEFLMALAARARAVGAVLIYDEIQCGLSRTGELWAHARLPAEAHPDVLTTAKALGNGFPIGATLVNGEVATALRVGDHGTTFGGNPLASRLGHHVLGRLVDPALQENVRRSGAALAKGLRALAAQYPDLISEVRGRGLIVGAQLTRDPAPIVKAAREAGLLVITAGTNTLRFLPALTISEAQVGEGLALLREAIDAAVWDS
jgi:acetylornithine aminotransferase